jgi:hypothetical protein
VEELGTVDRTEQLGTVDRTELGTVDRTEQSLKGKKQSKEVQPKFWNDNRILLFANHILPCCFGTHVRVLCI